MDWLYEASLIVIIVAIAVFMLIMAIHGYFMVRNRVPYVRLPEGALPEVARELDLNSADKVVDLGAGDGQVLAALQKYCPEASYIGYENNLIVWAKSKWRAPRGIQLIRGEIAAADISAASKVFVYLGPKLMAELEPRLQAELPAGARVVSAQFPLPYRRPDKIVTLGNSASRATCLYVYNY